jgi:hypothetical protein
MADTPSSSDTSLPAVENESAALEILYDILSVLNDQSITYQVAGQGFTDSLNLAIYQLKGIAPSSTATESIAAYPWAAVPRDQFIERVASLAVEAIELIESQEEEA